MNLCHRSYMVGKEKESVVRWSSLDGKYAPSTAGGRELSK